MGIRFWEAMYCVMCGHSFEVICATLTLNGSSAVSWLSIEHNYIRFVLHIPYPYLPILDADESNKLLLCTHKAYNAILFRMPPIIVEVINVPSKRQATIRPKKTHKFDLPMQRREMIVVVVSIVHPIFCS